MTSRSTRSGGSSAMAASAASPSETVRTRKPACFSKNSRESTMLGSSSATRMDALTALPHAPEDCAYHTRSVERITSGTLTQINRDVPERRRPGSSLTPTRRVGSDSARYIALNEHRLDQDWMADVRFHRGREVTTMRGRAATQDAKLMSVAGTWSSCTDGRSRSRGAGTSARKAARACVWSLGGRCRRLLTGELSERLERVARVHRRRSGAYVDRHTERFGNLVL